MTAVVNAAMCHSANLSAPLAWMMNRLMYTDTKFGVMIHNGMKIF